MCGNHDAMAEDARVYFLTFDQEKLIEKFHLDSDAEYLYITVLQKIYQIDRINGFVTEKESGAMAPHDIKMAIYDMLCYSKDLPLIPNLSGTWMNLAQLGGIIGAGHAKRLHTPEIMKPFLEKVPELQKICDDLKGERQKGGDVSCIIPVFDFFPVWFQYWDADEEFPANIQFLWDKNATEFLHYEILFYLTFYLEQWFAELINS